MRLLLVLASRSLCPPGRIRVMITLVVVLKVPTLHKSKTRLIPALGADGAFEVATAMVSDTLRRLSRIEARRVAYFAPEEKRDELIPLIPAGWDMLPMRSNLLSCDLGPLLRHAYVTLGSPILFVGMDTPDIPLAFIEEAKATAEAGKAVVRDAVDGGYVILAVPARAPPEIFDDVEWSTANTAQSQKQRLLQCGVPLCTKPRAPWYDVDDMDDLAALKKRLPPSCEALALL